MNKGVLLMAAGWLAVLTVPVGSQSAARRQVTPVLSPVVSHASQPTSAAGPATSYRALLDKYCVTCHNPRTNAGNLTLDTASLTALAGHEDVWERVVRKLRAGVMPPAGRPRPDKATHDGFVNWLETELDRASAAHPNPGRTETFHRLNRTQYRNVVRDLLGLQVDVSALLPADDASYGFDNIAGVLRVSPVLMERYLSAAQRLSRLAVGTAPPSPSADIFRLRGDLAQADRLEELPFGTRGGTVIDYNFPQDADYAIKVELLKNRDDRFFITEPNDVEVSIDGERVEVFALKPLPPRRRPAPAPAAAPPGGAAPVAQPQPLQNNDDDVPPPSPEVKMEVRVPVKAGARKVVVTFVKKTSAVEETLRQPFLRPYNASYLEFQASIGTVTISGPFQARGELPSEDTESRRRIFTCRPATVSEESACAKQILESLGRRAYRRPVSDTDLQGLMAFFAQGRKEGGSFDAGIEMAVQALLVSPEFLFRVERDPATAAVNERSATYRVSDLELATRLSFFLWNSIPDDELLDLASKGSLRQPVVLERQVRRLLADERSRALVSDFAGQWLFLRNIPAIAPDEVSFPDFDEGLRLAMRRETELFVESIVREDRSALDLLGANYTFINERLARHYGIANVYGSHFRRYTFPIDSLRGGLLGHASILTVTSYAHRTSPVLRGKWILENLLGTPPPPPPPNVPDLRDTNTEGKVLSMRERMVQHRANPACAVCHSMMDPPGLALEHFDAVGRWRDLSEANAPIDASGVLPDGTVFQGAAGLRSVLLAKPDLFVTTLTERLLIYALGRGLEHYDAPAIRAIRREAAKQDYRFSSIILAIVNSTPFQMRRSES